MPQLDYDYEEAYSYRSSGKNSRSNGYYYSENIRKTSEKTKNQVFDLMNDNLAYKPRYKSISEYGIPQEVRNRSFYAEEAYRRRKNIEKEQEELDLLFKPKITFDYDSATTAGTLRNIKSKPEEVELEEVETEKEERKQRRREERRKAFKAIRTTMLVLLGFAVAFFICYRYSIINEKFNLVEKSKKELLNVQTVNEQLQADIERETDLSYIENYARYQMGMQKPQSSQTIYINTEKQDKIFTPVKTDEETTSDSTFDTIIEKISSIF